MADGLVGQGGMTAVVHVAVDTGSVTEHALIPHLRDKARIVLVHQRRWPIVNNTIAQVCILNMQEAIRDKNFEIIL